MAKFKVKNPETGEVTEIEVEGAISLEEVKENYLPRAVFQAELDKRVKSILSGEDYVKADDLLEDSEFRTKALELWGETLGGGGDQETAEQRAALIQEAIGKERKKWDRELVPMREGAEKDKATISKLRQKELAALIIEAARPDVADSLLVSPGNGMSPAIVNLLAPMFGFNAEADTWAVRDGDDFAYSTNP
ncbi:MAG: hypothetical protein ACYTFQ_21585, partial [Planctomycetota bacterium]